MKPVHAHYMYAVLCQLQKKPWQAGILQHICTRTPRKDGICQHACTRNLYGSESRLPPGETPDETGSLSMQRELSSKHWTCQPVYSERYRTQILNIRHVHSTKHWTIIQLSAVFEVVVAAVCVPRGYRDKFPSIAQSQRKILAEAFYNYSC